MVMHMKKAKWGEGHILAMKENTGLQAFTLDVKMNTTGNSNTSFPAYLSSESGPQETEMGSSVSMAH